MRLYSFAAALLVPLLAFAAPASASSHFASGSNCEPVDPFICASGTIVTSTVADSFCSGTKSPGEVCKKFDYSGSGQAVGPQSIMNRIIGTHNEQDECMTTGAISALCRTSVTGYLFINPSSSHCWTLKSQTFSLLVPNDPSVWILSAEVDVRLGC